MVGQFLTRWLAAGAFSTLLVRAEIQHSPRCRFIPSDAGWPTDAEWTQLNKTVGGRLIATDPQAHVCHDPTVHNSKCAAIKAPINFGGNPPAYETRLNVTPTEWDNAVTYIDKPAEIINAFYQNQSCDPFTPATKPCVLGNYAVYSINVTGADDVIAGLQFVQEKNVRLSIRTTGHDYNGKSSGQASLSLWTRNLKTAEIIHNYESPSYSGPAIKLGAGILGGEGLLAAEKGGYRMVTGECGTVGLTGGYSQGGGHSILNSAYGMAADNVLEWELVTGEGKHIIATPERHSQLYWALSGGGGGTYGVVLSMITKIYKESPVQDVALTFDSPNVGNETYWKGVSVFHKHLASNIVTGTNNSAQYNIFNNQFAALFVFLDKTRKEIDATLAPLFTELTHIGLPYNTTFQSSVSYKNYYNMSYGPLPYGLEPPSTILNSRIIPKSVAIDAGANSKLIDAMKLTTRSGQFLLGCTAFDVTYANTTANAVLPAWREGVSMCIMNAFWNFTAPLLDNYKVKRVMVDSYAPAFDRATPGSGVYLNEIDPWYKGDFKTTMYGVNYDRLLQIKHKHDPHHMFYGHHAVGGDEFDMDASGRLCYVGG